MKVGITEHPNAYVGRIKNRRTTVLEKTSGGVIIQFTSLQESNEPLAQHHHERGVTDTIIALSEEGTRLLFEMLACRFERKDKLERQ